MVGCQEVELTEPSSTPDIPDVSGEATIKISVSLPESVQTKAMGDSPVTDIKNLYLIIFDSNGYFVEARQAEIGNRTNDKAEYTVTLTMTNQKRIIHFIANCPIDQIGYGHENEVISKLYVKKAKNEGDIETAYWFRKEVDYIIANEAGELLDLNLQKLTDDKNPFMNIPLLRNYTQITVEDNDDEDDNFQLLSYAVYNTIDMGTVAPYNKSKLGFQMFGRDGLLFSYDRLLSEGFEGHALAEATLDGDVEESDFMEPGTPYFMYERKISVRSGAEESQWDESPTHIIIKGIYTGEGHTTNTTPSYYKVDLIREINNSNQYYNLLRNFDYTFKLRSVAGAGYKSIKDAMDNPAGNNLAGSTHTQELTDVSDGTGRIMVSYTDTTLVSNHDITFKFRYIPDIHHPAAANKSVSLQGELDGNGNVLKGLKTTINYGSDDDDWATVVFRVNDPTDVTQIQEITLNVGNNPNLQKTIRFKLMKPYSLDIICYDRTHQNQTFDKPDNVIPEGIGEALGIYLRIPPDLTRDMFPLEFKVEADKLSISPDVSEGNTVPVISGQSIIPGKPDPAFHYLFTIKTYEQYKSLLYDETSKKNVVITRWLTNLVKSASYVVVDNKYFNIAASYFRNDELQTEKDVLGHDRRFTDLRVDPNPVFYGTGESVKIMFDLDSREHNFLPKLVHAKLEGMECTTHKETAFDIFLCLDPVNDPVGRNLDPNTKIVKMQPGSRSAIVDGLVTTVVSHSDTYNANAQGGPTGPIRFTLNADGYYEVSSDVAGRIEPKFTMLSISPDPIIYGEGVPVDIKFMMDSDDDRYFDRPLTVTLNGLQTANGERVVKITPTEGSLVVRINDLVTSTANGDVSFKVESDDKQYETRTSEVVKRRYAEFWGLRFNPAKVAAGADKTVAISFNMDEEDDNFANRELTLTLTGMAYVAPDGERLTTLTFTPSDKSLFPKLTRYMTIGNLVTTGDGDVSFKITAEGYSEATQSASRSAVEFKNLSFTRNGDIVSRINDNETVDFNFTMSYFESGMTVDVTLDGFEPYDMPTSGDGSLVAKATRAATVYEFKPYERNCKLKLKAVSTDAPSYSVSLAAADYGFASASKGISKAVYRFNAETNKATVTANEEATITFDIPADAYKSGMTVNVTLNGLIPTENNKLVGSNGSYVYTINNKTNNNEYSFKVKPSGTDGGIRTVKLEADYFINEEISIEQKIKLTQVVSFNFSNNSNGWNQWGNGASGSRSNGTYNVTTTSSSTDKDAAQIAYDPSNEFVKGRKYVIKFDIKSTVSGKVYPYMQYAKNETYTPQGDFINTSTKNNYVEVTNQTQTVTMEGICEGNCNRLIIAIGNIKGTITLDNFSISYYE